MPLSVQKFQSGHFCQVPRITGYDINEDHYQITSHILKALEEDRSKDIQSDILQAANIRRFLGLKKRTW